MVNDAPFLRFQDYRTSSISVVTAQTNAEPYPGIYAIHAVTLGVVPCQIADFFENRLHENRGVVIMTFPNNLELLIP